jgi:hypothetical protein
MGVVDTTYTFNSTDTITSSKLNNIIDDTFFTSTAISGSSLQIVSPGKLAVAAGGITSNELASNSVTTAKISDGSIIPAKLSDSDFGDFTVSSGVATIDNGAITPAKLSQPATFDTVKNSTSGTSIDFTGIPSWAKRVTVVLQGVSTSGTSGLMIQVGASSGFVTSGYSSAADLLQSGVAPSNWTTGFGLENTVISGGSGVLRNYTCTIINISGNNWVFSMIGSTTVVVAVSIGGGNISLGGILDRVRLTTFNGTDTFDVGSVNIIYE